MSLEDGAPLIVEDIDVTLPAVTYQGPYRFGFWRKLWKNISCKHKYSLWFGTKYCGKCGVIK